MNIDTASVWQLNARIEFLRNKDFSLLTGSSNLLAYGLTAHRDEVFAELKAIRAEARAISQRLHELGATADADKAADGWSILIPPRPLPTKEVHS